MSNWSHEIQTVCPFYEDLLEPKIFSFSPFIQKIEFKFKITADWKKQQKQAKRTGKDQEVKTQKTKDARDWILVEWHECTLLYV